MAPRLVNKHTRMSSGTTLALLQLAGVCLCLLCGCAGTKQFSRYDEFDTVKIDQMSGNVVSGKVFGNTLLALNARRETRRITAVTNQVMVYLTNSIISTVTNQVITGVTNQSSTTATNTDFFPQTVANSAGPDSATNRTAATEPVPPAATDTAPALSLVGSQPSASTNLSVSSASNQTVSRASNQTIATIQMSTAINTQTMLKTNNLTINTQSNLQVTLETNRTITTLTNQTITAVTNQLVIHTNLLVKDYFLYTELIAPPDFVLSPSESLVLLIDDARYVFTQTTSPAAFVGRRGVTSTLYRATPEVLVAIANAKEVRIRVKGVSSVIERVMPERSRANFKEFLADYFVPEPGIVPPLNPQSG